MPTAKANLPKRQQVPSKGRKITRVTRSLSKEQRKLLSEMDETVKQLVRHGISLETARERLEAQYKSSKAIRRGPLSGLVRRRLDVLQAEERRARLARIEAEKLTQIQQLLGLSLTELGHLIGASRQAVSAWFSKGVPAARKSKAVTVLNLAELLERKLKPGRLPAVARKSAMAYGGRSMLEMIEADLQDQLLQEARESFDWAATS